MKINDARLEAVAIRLAEAVVDYYVKGANSSPPREGTEELEELEVAKGFLRELRVILDQIEPYPPWLNLSDLKGRKSLSLILVGLSSFLTVVQRYPEEVLAWDDLPDAAPEKTTLAQELWSRESIY